MFKAGDWVTIGGTLPQDKFQLTENEIKYKEILLGPFNFSEDKWKLWKPKEGEWVVRTQVNGKAGTYISGFDVLMWTNEDVYECEPFIGKLPSFVRD